MPAQVFAGGETFPTLGAGKRAFSGVDFSMDREIRRFREALPALFTRVGVLPGMNLLVSCKIQMTEKRFPAFGASVQFPEHVDFLVGGKS